MTDKKKKTVLVIGAGSVGAIAALNLEVGGLAAVTVSLRSNYSAVKEHGYTIESCDHGSLKGFRPSVGVLYPTVSDFVSISDDPMQSATPSQTSPPRVLHPMTTSFSALKTCLT